MEVAEMHEKLTPISELVTGHANRLKAQGCPDELAWQMAEQVHRLMIEGQLIEQRAKLIAAEAALQRQRDRKR